MMPIARPRVNPRITSVEKKLILKRFLKTPPDFLGRWPTRAAPLDRFRFWPPGGLCPCFAWGSGVFRFPACPAFLALLGLLLSSLLLSLPSCLPPCSLPCLPSLCSLPCSLSACLPSCPSPALGPCLVFLCLPGPALCLALLAPAWGPPAAQQERPAWVWRGHGAHAVPAVSAREGSPRMSALLSSPRNARVATARCSP